MTQEEMNRRITEAHYVANKLAELRLMHSYEQQSAAVKDALDLIYTADLMAEYRIVVNLVAQQ